MDDLQALQPQDPHPAAAACLAGGSNTRHDEAVGDAARGAPRSWKGLRTWPGPPLVVIAIGEECVASALCRQWSTGVGSSPGLVESRATSEWKKGGDRDPRGGREKRGAFRIKKVARFCKEPVQNSTSRGREHYATTAAQVVKPPTGMRSVQTSLYANGMATSRMTRMMGTSATNLRKNLTMGPMPNTADVEVVNADKTPSELQIYVIAKKTSSESNWRGGPRMTSASGKYRQPEDHPRSNANN
uniref:Predicted protein n=1 Tax=Physcomitrium patens TaxID=3218 RepID=A9U5A5_PHYPA